MGNWLRLLILGFLLMIGFVIAYFLAGLLTGLLFMVLPPDGTLALVGMILSWVITAIILATVILFIVRRFH